MGRSIYCVVMKRSRETANILSAKKHLSSVVIHPWFCEQARSAIGLSQAVHQCCERCEIASPCRVSLSGTPGEAQSDLGVVEAQS